MPDVLRSDQFSEKSDGQHLESDDEASERIHKQRAGADGAEAVYLKSGQNPAYSQVSESCRAEQESGKTDPAKEMKRSLAEDRKEDNGEKIQKALNKSMKPVLRSPVAPWMMLDGQLGDAIAPGVGHHRDEAEQLSV